jgi:MoxR-like ATPase
VVEAFKKVITNQHVSFDDAATEIRTSPRRWEQVVLYVNANVPVQTAQQAAALLSSVRSMFQDQDQTSSLYAITEAAVREIIGQTGAEHLRDTAPLKTSEWRDTLLHQVQTKMRLGDSRTYVPIISGQPGIGKTAQAADVAQKLNMLMIHIDCSTLTTDEITGIPIPDKSEGRMAVQFSEPALYKKIVTDIEEDTAAFMADPGVSAEKKKAFETQPYKYLIFFDELNRVKSNSVFNSLRRVILEKSFNDQVGLPQGSVVIAAMNPYDKGTAELTGHLKDSTDYIDTAPSWKMTKSYLEDVAVNMPSVVNLHEQAKKIGLDIVDSFVKQFALKKTKGNISGDSRQFYIPISDDLVYVSPREMTTMLLDLIKGIDRAVGRAAGMTPEQYSDAIADAAWIKLSSTLEWILDKHQINSPQFMNMAEGWLRQLSAKYLIKTRSAAAFEDMLDAVMQDHSKHLKDDVDFANYAKNFSRNKFAEDIENYLDKLIGQAKQPVDVAIAKNYPNKSLAATERAAAKNLISQFEYMENELIQAAETHNLSNDFFDEVSDIRMKLGTKLGPLITKDEHWDALGQALDDLSQKKLK